ncbi:MAG: hypothetical protein IPF54_00285 [Draconibacterium sp.]|nr:hypothetical protein [Draconibacterium sp.]
MKHLVKSSIVIISVIVLVACGASTKMLATWNNKELANNSYEKVAVVAVFKNTSNRYLTERAVVKNLVDANIKATATYEIFPFAGKVGKF